MSIPLFECSKSNPVYQTDGLSSYTATPADIHSSIRRLYNSRPSSPIPVDIPIYLAPKERSKERFFRKQEL